MENGWLFSYQIDDVSRCKDEGNYLISKRNRLRLVGVKTIFACKGSMNNFDRLQIRPSVCTVEAERPILKKVEIVYTNNSET